MPGGGLPPKISFPRRASLSHALSGRLPTAGTQHVAGALTSAEKRGLLRDDGPPAPLMGRAVSLTGTGSL